MYEFLLQEEFWLEAIVGAVITTLGTILVAVISYNYKIRKAFEDIAEIKKHEGLSKEHESLSKEHERLAKKYVQILDGIKDSKDNISVKIDETKLITNSIKEMVIETKTKNDLRYENLTDKQKLIIDSVKNLDYLASEIKSLQDDKIKLTQENDKLKERCEKLAFENVQLLDLLKPKQKNQEYFIEQ